MSRPKLFYSKKKMIQNFFGIKKYWLVVSSQNEIKSKKISPKKSFLKSKKIFCELLRANNYLLHLLFLGVNIDMIPYLIFFWVLIVTINLHFLELLKVFVRNKSYQEGRLIQHTTWSSSIFQYAKWNHFGVRGVDKELTLYSKVYTTTM